MARRLWWWAMLGVILLPAGAGAAGYSEHPAAREFVDRVSTEHGFDRAQLLDLFARANRQQSIIDAMERPAEKVKPWKDYRRIFIQEKRIDLGADFWRKHRDTLAQVSEEHGVDPAVIVAILGVETYYGRRAGDFQVLDALSTLAFDYPKRSPFFTKELENFLLLAREQGRDPLALKGSYAGAMGYGQFMPSSYRHYAVDQDGDGRIDIWDNPDDAIGSVANYLAEHGWRPGEPVAVRAKAEPDYDNAEFNRLRRPEMALAQHRDEGLEPVEGADESRPAMPLRLEAEDGIEYWLGFDNFYTITRYNHSHLYAMAVFQLSELIAQRVGRD